MTAWRSIPDDGKIESTNGCVIVRKRNNRGGWNVSIAYKDVSGFWRLDRGGFDEATKARNGL